MTIQQQRAILFIDGNNFYHGMKSLGLSSVNLNYKKFSQKLILSREWVETRYYIGQVKREGDLTRYSKQRKFLAMLNKLDRINYFLGRVESRSSKDVAKKLTRWLDSLSERLDVTVSKQVISQLRGIANTESTQYVEKAVDVMIATDMVSMAYENKYDVAYLLSADGDFTPAVKKAREIGRKVFVASPLPGYQISQVADIFIPLTREFFDDC